MARPSHDALPQGPAGAGPRRRGGGSPGVQASAPSEPSHDCAIRTRGLTRTFGKLVAVDTLDLDVPTGVVFGFLGPNGAGKTTTMRLLLGLLDPTGGQAQVLGLDPLRDGQAIRRQCGALIEEPGLYNRLTALENLEFFGRLHGVGRGQILDRAEELLGQLDLWDRRDDRVAGWSRGMRQKLAIARTLLHRPKLAFLDEPTAGLDVSAAARLRAELARMVEAEESSIFLATHSMREAEELCDLVGVFDEGHLVAVGTPGDLRDRFTDDLRIELHGTRFSQRFRESLARQGGVLSVEDFPNGLICRVTPQVEVSELVRLAVQAGEQLGEVKMIRPSLEQAFLRVVQERAR